MTATDITGVVGIVPTPSLPGADRPDAVDTVNLDETARMVDRLAATELDVLMTNGTFGEAATLTLDELLAFTDAVVRAAAGRVPVFAGATTLNTRDTIARGRELVRLGADGLFVGRPMWLPLDGEQIVGFYRAVADALPEVPIVVYDNAGAFKGRIPSAAYAELARIEQIVAAKHTGVRPGTDVYEADVRAVAGAFPLLPTLDSWVPSAEALPGQVPAAWCGDVACGPEPALVLRAAMAAGDGVRAKQVHDDLTWACETLFPGGDFAAFMQYSIQIDRAEFAAAGWIVPGPARPPYTSAPAAHLEGGAEVGRRWAELCRRYAGSA